MARPFRIEYEGAFYHVTAHGNKRKKIFFLKSDIITYFAIGIVAKRVVETICSFQLAGI